MVQSRLGAFRPLIAAALLFSAILVGIGPSPSGAEVTAVTGSAFGVSAPNISLFGGAQPAFGPTPSVTLPTSGSATPVTATDPTENVTFGPATFLSSGPATATTQGTLASGSVTSSTSVQAIAQLAGGCPGTETSCIYNGPFTADQVASTCTSAGGTNTATTTLTNGQLITLTDPDGISHPVIQSVANPAVNLTIDGVTFPSNNDRETFTYIFNEQIVNGDGSLTVNAVHEILHGPTAKGEVILGHAVCGVTGVPTTTTTTAPTGSTTTTTPTGPTTTTTAPTTTTTGPTTTTTAAPTTSVAPTTTTTPPVVQVGGSAFGFFTNVGLFGGPLAVRGPSPTVKLPVGGSATPVTASIPSGVAVYGPASIFESGPETVSTQGTPTGSVTSSTSITGCATATTNSCNAGEIYGGPFTATSVTSTCTASATGVSASTTMVNAKIVTLDDDNSIPITTVNVPDPIPPNYTQTGTITTVKGFFKYVLNEQIRNSDGSITVNAAHEYLGLGGPAGVDPGPGRGDAIIGQAVCARSASSDPAAQLAAATAADNPSLGNGATAAGSSTLAGTGIDVMMLFKLALLLLATGLAMCWAADVDRRDRTWPE